MRHEPECVAFQGNAADRRGTKKARPLRLRSSQSLASPRQAMVRSAIRWRLAPVQLKPSINPLCRESMSNRLNDEQRLHEGDVSGDIIARELPPRARCHEDIHSSQHWGMKDRSRRWTLF